MHSVVSQIFRALQESGRNWRECRMRRERSLGGKQEQTKNRNNTPNAAPGRAEGAPSSTPAPVAHQHANGAPASPGTKTPTAMRRPTGQKRRRDEQSDIGDEVHEGGSNMGGSASGGGQDGANAGSEQHGSSPLASATACEFRAGDVVEHIVDEKIVKIRHISTSRRTATVRYNGGATECVPVEELRRLPPAALQPATVPQRKKRKVEDALEKAKNLFRRGRS